MAAVHPLKYDKHQECVAQPRIIAAHCCENESRACINKSRVSSDCGSLCSTNDRNQCKKFCISKTLEMPTIPEVVPPPPFKDMPNIVEIERNYALHLSSKRNVPCRENYHKEKSYLDNNKI